MKTKKKSVRLEIQQPGERNAFWDEILNIRDAGDPRWLGTFSHGFRLTAEAYERVRDVGVVVKVAA